MNKINIILKRLKSVFNNRNKSPKNAVNKKKRKTILTVLFSFLTVFVLTTFFVIIYVAGYIISYTGGKAKIILEEYTRDQSRTSFVYAFDKAGNEVVIEKLHGEENRVWANLNEISPDVAKAFISLEDKRFREHHGVDWVRFFGVITKYNFEQGASTITQQLIKNLTGEKDVTIIRKFNEILSALNLENNYSKDLILETYLNTVALGNGCYGVRTAAEKYFGKDVGELNLAESASLAAITKAPFSFDPLYHYEKNAERQRYCLSEMLTQGVISQDEYNDAINYKIIYTNNPNYVPKENTTDPVLEPTEYQSFYIDFVIDNVISDLMSRNELSLQEATRKIYYGGLKIYAAVDLDVQKSLEDVYYNRITFPKESDTPNNPAAQSAMTVMDYEGRVVGIIGQAGPKTGNRVLNRAANSPRQPGSTIKPLATYAPAIEMNYVNWSTMILDYAFPYKGVGLWPKNVDKTYGSNTYVTVQKAIQLSLNTVAARVNVDKVTPAKSMEFLQEKFHISTLDPVNDPFAAPMSVGALSKGMTTLELAAAYAVFGNGGKYYKPYSYYKVTDSEGRDVFLENKPVGEQVLSPDTADIMCELLQTVDTSLFGQGNNVRNFQIMSKTGTSDDYKDRWVCGGTPYYVTSVWYGYDNPKDSSSTRLPAGKLYLEVLDRISKGLEPKTFPKSGLTVQKNYCTVSGLLAGSNCASTNTGWYKISNLPGVCTTCSSQTPVIDDIIDSIIDVLTPRESTTAPLPNTNLD